MRGSILFLLAVPTVSLAAPPSHAAGNPSPAAASKAACDRYGPQWAARSSAKAQYSELGALPPGNLFLTVVRDLNGCTEPTIVGYGYGSVTARPATRPNAPAPSR